LKAIYKKIEKRILERFNLVKEVSIKEIDGRLIAVIYPDFEAFQQRKIINISDEIKWYVVGDYNLEPIDNIEIDAFKILQHPLKEKEVLYTDVKKEESVVYKEIKTYLRSVTSADIYPDSHLELDLDLDSLEYVMLFMFIEKSFGLLLDEPTFSNLMRMQPLCDWVEEHCQRMTMEEVSWSDLLKKPSRDKLVNSPFIMMVWKAFCWTYFKLYHRFKVIGSENLPEGSFIIAPIHLSMLDGFAVLAALPSPILRKSFFLAYEGEFGKPHLKPIAKYSQMLLIDINKDLNASLQRTAQPLKESKNLVIFPENARSRDGKLLPFKKFYTILSKELNLPIVPVVLRGTFEALPSGQSWPKPKEVSVEFLDAIYPENRDYKSLSDVVESKIRAVL